MNKNPSPKLVARLTIRHSSGTLVTVEVHSDAGHNDFFKWYRRRAGECRRELIRESQRAQGGLETIAAYCSKDKRTKVTIRNRKLYQQLLSCRTEELPGYKPVISSVKLDLRTFWGARAEAKFNPLGKGLQPESV